MQCPRCGNNLDYGSEFCGKCGTRIYNGNNPDNKETVLCSIGYIFLGLSILFLILVMATKNFNLIPFFIVLQNVALIISIFAKIKYPNSKMVLLYFIINMIYIVILIILGIWFISECTREAQNALESCRNM